jgi:hypothetical protein
MGPFEFIGSVHRVTIDEVGSNSLFGTFADQNRTMRLIAAGA